MEVPDWAYQLTMLENGSPVKVRDSPVLKILISVLNWFYFETFIINPEEASKHVWLLTSDRSFPAVKGTCVNTRHGALLD